MCDPLPPNPCCAFHLSGLGPLPPVGRRNTSRSCRRDCRIRSHCTLEGVPETPIATCSLSNDCRSGLHLRRCVVGRSPAFPRVRGFRHFDWKRIHDLRSQNESHILSRLQLQPLRLDSCHIVSPAGIERDYQAVRHLSEDPLRSQSLRVDPVVLASALDY